VRTKLLETFEVVLKEFFGEYDQGNHLHDSNKILIKRFFFIAKTSSDLCRIININQFKRLAKLLSETRGNVAIRGDIDEETRFIGLTVVTDLENDDPLMQVFHRSLHHKQTFGLI